MIHARNHVIVLVLVAAVLTIGVYGNHMLQLNELAEAHRAWQLEREAEMRELDTSWLALAGLYWLPEGETSFGAGTGVDLRLRDVQAPARLGRFVRNGEQVSFVAEPGVNVTLDGVAVERVDMQNDAGSDENYATTLTFGSLQWWIIARDGRLGVRVKDLESATWRAFAGIPAYAFDSAWRIEARFIPFNAPQPMEYPTILGTTRTENVPGVLQFEIGDQSFELLPFERHEGKSLWVVFADKSNGDTTYEGGRFLYVDMPADESGETVIDFNRAYNPPCAFTPYSTCPQPLPQNRMPIGVYAGEKKYE
ncbi:MAG: DUF1684 domain-containing protein [Rhodothermales bacterium]